MRTIQRVIMTLAIALAIPAMAQTTWKHVGGAPYTGSDRDAIFTAPIPTSVATHIWDLWAAGSRTKVEIPRGSTLTAVNNAGGWTLRNVRCEWETPEAFDSLPAWEVRWDGYRMGVFSKDLNPQNCGNWYVIGGGQGTQTAGADSEIERQMQLAKALSMPRNTAPAPATNGIAKVSAPPANVQPPPMVVTPYISISNNNGGTVIINPPGGGIISSNNTGHNGGTDGGTDGTSFDPNPYSGLYLGVDVGGFAKDSDTGFPQQVFGGGFHGMVASSHTYASYDLLWRPINGGSQEELMHAISIGARFTRRSPLSVAVVFATGSETTPDIVTDYVRFRGVGGGVRYQQLLGKHFSLEGSLSAIPAQTLYRLEKDGPVYKDRSIAGVATLSISVKFNLF